MKEERLSDRVVWAIFLLAQSWIGSDGQFGQRSHYSDEQGSTYMGIGQWQWLDCHQMSGGYRVGGRVPGGGQADWQIDGALIGPLFLETPCLSVPLFESHISLVRWRRTDTKNEVKKGHPGSLRFLEILCVSSLRFLISNRPLDGQWAALNITDDDQYCRIGHQDPSSSYSSSCVNAWGAFILPRHVS